MNEVFRQEKKYFMTISDLLRLAGRLDQVLLQDEHNGSQGYRIRSLYFDTLEEGDFWEKIEGVSLRRKLRLRIYDPGDPFAMLEMKQKQGDYQRKRSLRLTRQDAEAMCRGDYACLLTYRDPFAAECYGLMCRRCYRSKTIVEYQRKAYIAKENRIRVTLDHQIRATETSFALFDPALNTVPVLDPFHGILEVKYNGFLLTYIKQLLGQADRSALSASKYCLARSASLHFGL